MNINIKNYEAFLLDHIEGRLTKHQSILLKAFIHQHPELGKWEELSAALPNLIPEVLAYDLKNNLLQKATNQEEESNYSETEALFIGFHEGINTASEQKKLSDFLLNHPAAEKDFQLFGKTFLHPDLNIVFPEKKQLLKKAPLMAFRPLPWVAVAASITLLIGWGWWWINQESTNVEAPPTYVVAAPITVDTEALAIPLQDKIQDEDNQTLQTKTSLKSRKPNASAVPVERFETKVLPALQTRSHTHTLSLAVSHHQELRERTHGIAERLALSNIIDNMTQAVAVESQGATERILNKVVNDALNTVNPALREAMAENTSKTQNSSLWDLAQKGIQTFNFLTDNDIQLVKVNDGSENKKAILLNSDLIHYSRISAAGQGEKTKM